MRDHLQIETGTLFANLDDRTAEGLLLPFGEIGSTNIGRVSVAPDAVPDPADLDILAVNVDHDQLRPAARFAWLQRAPHGILAGFRIGKGAAGDELLADIKAGRRSKLSVELANVIRRGDVVVSAELTGAAFVDAGAFPSAALLASLVEPEPEPEDDDDETDPTTDPNPDQEEPMPTTTPPAPAGTDGAIAPAGLHASHAGPTPTAPALTARGLFAALAHARETRSNTLLQPYLEEAEAAGNLFAALTDIKFDGSTGLAPTMVQPAWLGELWNLRTVRRRIVPLLAHRPLTGMKAAGFRWKTRPKMAPWGANKTAVPSNPAEVEAYEVEAQPFAGAHDIDIRFKHFTVPGFWESYWRHMSDSYAIETDAKAFADLQAAATPLTPGTVPANVPAGLSYVVDGALQMIDDALPTYAIVAKNLWRDMVLMADEHKLAFLSGALKLDGGDLEGFQIVPAALPDNTVIVGHREAAAFHELDGTPIRVEGLDIVKGGIDPAAFGYAATVIHDPAGIVKVAPAAG